MTRLNHRNAAAVAEFQLKKKEKEIAARAVFNQRRRKQRAAKTPSHVILNRHGLADYEEVENAIFNYPIACFDGAEMGSPHHDSIKETNKRLAKYGSEVLSVTESMILNNAPLSTSYHWRRSTDSTNFCINPLQAIRGWALLANIAEDKTLIDIKNFIYKYIKKDDDGQEKTTSYVQQMNTELLGLHVDIEEDIDGCVRLFTDLQRHLKPDEFILNEASKYYGGKGERSAVQQLCFQSDADGFYSCYRINEEMMLSTNQAIQYVVPEQYAPNWRSSIALASCSDCTFYWKTFDAQDVQMRFDTEQKTPGIYASANVKTSPADRIYQLESYYDDFKLYIITRSYGITESIISEIEQSSTWDTAKRHVLIPKCLISTPLSLQQHSQQHGLKRLYCSEKSELIKLSGNVTESKSHFLTLWDHYHKTNFQIIASKPTPREKNQNNELKPSKAHIRIDENMSELYTSLQKRPEKHNESMFKYYEDHLDKDASCVAKVAPTEELFKPEEHALLINNSFSFVVTRECNGFPIILCTGHFTNNPWLKGDNYRNSTSIGL